MREIIERKNRLLKDITTRATNGYLYFEGKYTDEVRLSTLYDLDLISREEKEFFWDMVANAEVKYENR